MINRIEKSNNNLVQPIFPVQKIENEENVEKRRHKRQQMIEDEVKKKREPKNVQNTINIIV